MTLKLLHDTKKGEMRVVGLMSGSGSNLRKILEYEIERRKEYEKCSYRMVAIFTDNSDSKAPQIGKEFDIPVVVRDLKGFYAKRGRPRSDMKVRAEFDSETVKALAPYGATVAAYGGYMSIATQPLMDAFLGINVHPADLSVMQGERRKYTGDHAVRDAILAGEKTIRSTTHVIEPMVDGGRILMVSPPLEVRVGDNFDPTNKDLVAEVEEENQSRLKEIGDWIVFPRTLSLMGNGRYSRDENGMLYFDEKPIPLGLRLD